MQSMTSLDAWGIIQHELGERQFDIFYKLTHLGQATNNELADHYQIPINRVTPRMLELREMGLVRYVTTRPCKITKFKAKVWAPAEYEQAIEAFRKYLAREKRLEEKGEVQREFVL